VQQSWAKTWVERHSSVERSIDLGDRVFLLTVERLLGRDGIEVTEPSGGILTFLDEKIVRIE
jgi:hypothetical protein